MSDQKGVCEFCGTWDTVDNLMPHGGCSWKHPRCWHQRRLRGACEAMSRFLVFVWMEALAIRKSGGHRNRKTKYWRRWALVEELGGGLTVTWARP